MVRMKYVTLGQMADGLRVIKSGLAEDDRVIVNGLMRARPGQKVDAAGAAGRPPKLPPVRRKPRRIEAARCGFRISSSTGRSSRR